MKIVKNTCYGGFGLSHEAHVELAKRKGLTICWREEYSMHHYYTSPDMNDDSYWYPASDMERTDPDLIAVIEKLGKKSWGQSAELGVVDIPDGVEYEIDNYDGIETIHEVHRSW